MTAPGYPADRLERSRFFDGPVPRTPERERQVAILAALVEEGEAFAERELTAAPGSWRYRLRGSRRQFLLRHGTQDVAILDEVFHKRLYEPPPPVHAALARSPGPLTVVDAGANIGLFSVFIAERLRPKTIVAIEPDPFNLELLEACLESGAYDADCRILAACAGARGGSVRFHAGLFASSRIAESESAKQETTATPMIDVFPYVASADLVKIDIEGGEWALLSDPRLATMPTTAIALEFHFHLNPPGAPPGRLAERLLHAAGFRTQVLHERRDGQGMLWAWRETGG